MKADVLYAKPPNTKNRVGLRGSTPAKKHSEPVEVFRTSRQHRIIRIVVQNPGWDASELPQKLQHLPQKKDSASVTKESFCGPKFGLKPIFDYDDAKMRRVYVRVTDPEAERRHLISDYQRLVDLEMARPLTAQETDLLMGIEKHLDQIDAQDQTAVAAIEAYRAESSKLKELNEIAERLKNLR